MMLAGSAMLLPLFGATYLSTRASEHWWWWLLAAWLAGGYVATLLALASFAPSRIELRDDGLYARYWYGSRLADWSRLQPGRRPFSIWQGWMVVERTDDDTWRHYLLTREQARAVLQDGRFLRREEASLRVRTSLGLDRAASTRPDSG